VGSSQLIYYERKKRGISKKVETDEEEERENAT